MTLIVITCRRQHSLADIFISKPHPTDFCVRHGCEASCVYFTHLMSVRSRSMAAARSTSRLAIHGNMRTQDTVSRGNYLNLKGGLSLARCLYPNLRVYPLFSRSLGINRTHKGLLSHKIQTPCSRSQSRAPIFGASSSRSKCHRICAKMRRISA